MPKTTIIRKIDDLGRLVLPKDVRKNLDIHNGDLLELSIHRDSLSITKYSSIQKISYLSEMIWTSLYEEYHIEGMLFEEHELMSYPTNTSKKKMLEKYAAGNYLETNIVMENREVGKLVLLTNDERYQKLLSFLSLFFKKYLEES